MVAFFAAKRACHAVKEDTLANVGLDVALGGLAVLSRAVAKRTYGVKQDNFSPSPTDGAFLA